MLWTIALLMAVIDTATAHTIMQAVGVGSKMYAQGLGIYMPSDDSVSSTLKMLPKIRLLDQPVQQFIADVTSDSLACNGPPVTNFASSSDVISVKAGDTVTGAWLHTLTSTTRSQGVPHMRASGQVLIAI